MPIMDISSCSWRPWIERGAGVPNTGMLGEETTHAKSSVPSLQAETLAPNPNHYLRLNFEDTMVKCTNVGLVLLSILFPPAAVAIIGGCGHDLLIAIFLTV
ncbi:hypothetical protein BDV93DRAFT_607822 [Ceratobasidium sp. AG-I]|nr:hypothetical protein BDV93DRAFT_607822 [Ceratobasidium sp. AG-I]